MVVSNPDQLDLAVLLDDSAPAFVASMLRALQDLIGEPNDLLGFAGFLSDLTDQLVLEDVILVGFSEKRPVQSSWSIRAIRLVGLTGLTIDRLDFRPFCRTPVDRLLRLGLYDFPALHGHTPSTVSC